MPAYDVIVIGMGGVGSAALFHLAQRGARVLGLDQFPPGHDRGSSHGQTRIIRLAYFEHADYVPLLKRAYQLWEALELRSATTLYREVGLLQIGPTDGIVLPGTRASAHQHALPIESLSAAEIRREYPGFALDDAWSGLLERRAGILFPEACVLAHLREAEQLGAEISSAVTVLAWRPTPSGVVVITTHGDFTGDRLVIAAGAWSSQILRELNLPLVVRRKSQLWFAPRGEHYLANRGCPAFLFETPNGIFYGTPQLDERGPKVAEHSGGALLEDPSQIASNIEADELQRVSDFCADHMPGLTDRLTRFAPCMYTLTPDEHFVVDRHPHAPQVAFAGGLSGHGFKFTPVLGEALADLCLAGRTDLPIGFLGLHRAALERKENGRPKPAALD